MNFPRFALRSVWLILLIVLVLSESQCSKNEKPSAAKPLPSDIEITVNPNGPVTVTTRAAEFQLLPSGYVQGFLIKNGAKLTLDDPHTSTPHSPDYLLIEGKAIGFTPDFSQVRVVEPQGKLGRGKRIEIRAHAQDGTYQLQQTLVLEAYDDLPNVLLT